ncbi:MAG TPA: cupin domain-containing protein [Solirubrobacteraceae bacterium]|jgi:hypothetical protein|nr:cupin domain-containing protein [Solirubrobacteraceae bacterium]
MNAAETPQPFVTAYEDAPAYWSIGILWNVLISADQSFGAFTLMDQTMPEGAGPPTHMHERMHEGFYIIEGEITYTIGATAYARVARPPPTRRSNAWTRSRSSEASQARPHLFSLSRLMIPRSSS